MRARSRCPSIAVVVVLPWLVAAFPCREEVSGSCFPRSWGSVGNRARASPGQELFVRRWFPNDPRSHGGDGLGPVFNARSCVACHSQGAIGGGGPNERNVDVVTLTSSRSGDAFTRAIDVHPGFRDRRSVLLHKFGVDPRYDFYRRSVLALERARRPSVPVRVRRSQRNTPALFGAGVIEAIPEAAVVARRVEPNAEFAEIQGRVARGTDGKVGRFGWKAQTPTLARFVADACANEMGLELPDRHQAPSPIELGREAPGLDLSDEEVEAIRIFVAGLPPPREGPAGPRERTGRFLFESIGCATCHTPDLGGAKGIYSDLLLHVMAPEPDGVGSGYGGPPTDPESSEATDPERRPAAPSEWRTPPLWGVALSAPYLHDGRAPTLEKAILRHGGEADATVGRYRALAPSSREALVAFLESLGEPVAAARPTSGLRPGNMMGAMSGRPSR